MKSSAVPALPSLFCNTLIFIGSYFLLNLMLAVIMESYISSEEEEFIRIEQELEEEKNLMIERLNEQQLEPSSSASYSE